MSQASALMSVHAFELYGFGRPQLEATYALYGLDPHLDCNLNVFCRNPLHPGPCKGWKHSLKAIAPDVHAEKERKRLEQVHARREAKRQAARDAGLPEPRFRKLKHETTGGKTREGQGEGRDGDGDGLKGEGEYEKKGRKKATPKEPPAEKRLATLSPETLKTVSAAVKALPKSDDEWRAIGEQKFMRDEFAKLVQTNLDQVIEAQRNLTSSQDRFLARVNSGRTRRGNTPYADWNELARNEPDLADEWTKYDGTPLARAVVEADQRYGHTKDAYDAAEAEIARLGGRKPDGTVPDGFTPPQGFRARNFEHVAEYRPRVFPTDAAGRRLPPPELVAMHAKVQAAGAAMNQHIKDAISRDSEIERLKKRRAELTVSVYEVTGDARKARRDELTRVGQDMKRRERAYVMDALEQVRAMGGEKHANVRAMATQNDIMMNVQNAGNRGYTPAPPNWREQLDEAAAHFPDDWMRRANEHEMLVVSVDRAHMDSLGGDWRKGPSGGRHGVMAMDRDNAGEASGSTSFSSYGAEVTYHEFGHWMETNVPGLKALEFAYVRSKTTHNGQVEPLVKLKDVAGAGYEDREVGFKDQFANIYTGKTYETNSNDPMNSHWEAFQVGLQQTVGRGSDYGGPDLDDFVIGTLATLGRY